MKQSTYHKILITGATGLIGKALSEYLLANNIAVNFLTTDKSKIVTSQNFRGFYWNPAEGNMDIEALNGVDAIINLAGAPIDQKWTDRAKQDIFNSRISSVQTLYENLRKLEHGVRHIVNASAIGYYPSSTDLYYDETFELDESNGFLQSVVANWEASTLDFEDMDVIVTRIRIGLVLSSKGGVLKKLSSLARWGVLSPIGNGDQWQSWIHIDDLVRLFHFILEQSLQGIVNGVGPMPISNRGFVKAIVKSLGRRILLPAVPAFVVKAVFGEMANIILEGPKVCPKVALDNGFKFEHQTIESGLNQLVGSK